MRPTLTLSVAAATAAALVLCSCSDVPSSPSSTAGTVLDAGPPPGHGPPVGKGPPDGRGPAFLDRVALPIIPESGSPSTISTFGADGSDQRDLVTGNWLRYPSWSRDRSRMAFVSLAIGNNTGAGLYVADGDGSNVRRLLDYAVAQPRRPRMSPDGTKIVYRSQIESPGYLEVVDVATNVRSHPATPGPSGFATWSPDSRRLVTLAADDFNLWIYNVSDWTLARLTNDGTIEGYPYWSPDGSEILAAYGFGSGGGIAFFDAENGERTILATNDELAAQGLPSYLVAGWSPDGTQILLISVDFDEPTLFSIDREGTQLRRLFSVPDGHPFLPVWVR